VIRLYAHEGGKLLCRVNTTPQEGWLDGVAWIDLVAPTAVEETAVAQALGVDLPTREDLEEIEISSRLYLEDGAAFMTALLPSDTDTEMPKLGPVAFILIGDRLVTLRHHEPRPFATFPARAEKGAPGCATGDAVMLLLVEAAVDRLADILERTGREVDKLSRGIFGIGSKSGSDGADFRAVLSELGRQDDLISKARDSLVTLERLFGFFTQVQTQRGASKDNRTRLKTLIRDAHSLTEHADFQMQKITFLLDATLGLINIEQSKIIKIVSVAALVFLPPTVIASIYGMNFENMPELGWTFGYPMALGLMVLSGVLPYLFFKTRGWL
jgi:magnesium transporter